jgi:hypothetical protein
MAPHPPRNHWAQASAGVSGSQPPSPPDLRSHTLCVSDRCRANTGVARGAYVSERRTEDQRKPWIVSPGDDHAALIIIGFLGLRHPVI